MMIATASFQIIPLYITKTSKLYAHTHTQTHTHTHEQERSFLESLLVWHKEGVVVVHCLPPEVGGKSKGQLSFFFRTSHHHSNFVFFFEHQKKKNASAQNAVNKPSSCHFWVPGLKNLSFFDQEKKRQSS
jgi:hypothetical protein